MWRTFAAVLAFNHLGLLVVAHTGNAFGRRQDQAAELVDETVDLETKLATSEAALKAALAAGSASSVRAAASEGKIQALERKLAAAVFSPVGEAGGEKTEPQRKPRVLCFVPVGPPPEPEQGATLHAILRTWGQRCDGLVYLGCVGYELAVPTPTGADTAAAAAPQLAPVPPHRGLPRPFPVKGYATLKGAAPATGAALPPWQTQPLVIEEVKGCLDPTKRIDRDDGDRLWPMMYHIWWHVFEHYGDSFDWYVVAYVWLWLDYLHHCPGS
jgi:hypothetical protein